MVCVWYESHADKARRYVDQTLPLIFERGREGAAALRLRGRLSPRQIHDLARRGRYVAETGPHDCVPHPAETHRDGGDCDSWAAWLLAYLRATDRPARLVTAGDDRDNFRHVYVEAWDAGRWVSLDPKGSQEGKPFGVTPNFPIKRRWVVDAFGRVSELPRGSGLGAEALGCACVQGSGRDDKYPALFPAFALGLAGGVGAGLGSRALSGLFGSGQAPRLSGSEMRAARDAERAARDAERAALDAQRDAETAERDSRLLSGDAVHLGGRNVTAPSLKALIESITLPSGAFTSPAVLPHRVRTVAELRAGTERPNPNSPASHLNPEMPVIRERDDLRPVMLAVVPEARLTRPWADGEMTQADAETAINSWAELYRYAGDRHVSQLRNWLETGRGWRDVADALDRGDLGLAVGDLRRLLEWGWSRPANQGGFPGNLVGGTSERGRMRAELYKPLEMVRELEDLNLILASRWADGMLAESAETRQALLDFAVAVGGNPAAKPEELATVAAVVVTRMATGAGIALDDLFGLAGGDIHPGKLEAAIKRLVSESTPPQPGGNQFIALGSGNFFKQVLDIPRRVFAEAGRAIRNTGREMLRLGDNSPMLGNFVLRPAGFMLTAQLLTQTGNAMVSGSISDFGNREFGMEAGQTMVVTGQALTVASPFLPPPFNVGAAAIGGLSMVAGAALYEVSAGLADFQQRDQMIEACVDQYGNVVECVEAEAAGGDRAPDPQAQVVGEWRQGDDGLVYGWVERVQLAAETPDLGSGPHWWLALRVEGQQVTAGWAYDWRGQNWLQL